MKSKEKGEERKRKREKREKKKWVKKGSKHELKKFTCDTLEIY